MRRRRSRHLGAVLDLDGHQFRCFRIRHVLSRRGHAVPVLTWVSTCAAPGCGRAFEQRTHRKPRPVDMRPLCREHSGTRAERLALRRRARIVDDLVAELPDGRLVTMAGDVVDCDHGPDAGEATAWT